MLHTYSYGQLKSLNKRLKKQLGRHFLKNILRMEDSEERRYICRICSKICASGRSLGGHMRLHLAEIAASKKAAKAKAKIKVKPEEGDHDQKGSFGFQESFKNQSSREKFKNRPRKMDREDGDQSNGYELRENPKRSWKSSVIKHGLITSPKKKVSCKECGKKLPSLRALSGHMRCHSIKFKTKQFYDCKKCGKGFDSSRAMFGHMKTHSSKRSRAISEAPESLSELENLCPVRKKRSTVRYKVPCNPSVSSSIVSDNAVSDIWDIEEVAKWLIMLSRGVRESNNQDSVIKSFDKDVDDDNSVYFGSGSSSSYKSIEPHEKFNNTMSSQTGKRDACVFSGNKSAFAENNVSEADHKLGQIKSCEYQLKQETEDGIGFLSSDPIKVKEQESLKWLKVSASSCGHKRSHRIKTKSEEAMTVKQEVVEVNNLFDLNFPLSVTEGNNTA